MTPLLEVDGLQGGYSRAPVLRDIRLTMGSGQVVGLLGANGAGKTTLLRALSGTLPVARGEIGLEGRSLRRLSPWARVKAGLAHVPEGRHVFGHMSVRDNLDAAALVARGAVARDHVYALFPRLRERADQAAGSLSGGEQQMLAIGRAMMTNPRVLVIDELSAGLAPILVEQLIASLAQLKGTGTSLLLVEQSPHFIAEIVDHVFLLEQGRIVGSGTLAELGGVDALADLYLGVH